MNNILHSYKIEKPDFSVDIILCYYLLMQKLDPNNYYIKEGYKSQNKNFNISENRDTEYWSRGRLQMNLLFQHDVYIYAKEIIRRYQIESVADVGCGVAEKMMKHIYPVAKKTVGIDMEYPISIAKKIYPINANNFLADNFENSKDLHDNKFDLVICSDVIEHIFNPDLLLEYLKSLGTESTYFIISTPERDLHRGFDCMESQKKEHVREWNENELRTYLENNGFAAQEQFTVSFIKKSFTNLRALKTYNNALKSKGTTKTTQVILCKLHENTAKHHEG